MFFSLKELLRWLGLTVFEIFTFFLAVAAFSALVVIKSERFIDDEALTWWWVYSPLFTADVLNAYFCIIVYIRMHIEVKNNICTL